MGGGRGEREERRGGVARVCERKTRGGGVGTLVVGERPRMREGGEKLFLQSLLLDFQAGGKQCLRRSDEFMGGN